MFAFQWLLAAVLTLFIAQGWASSSSLILSTGPGPSGWNASTGYYPTGTGSPSRTLNSSSSSLSFQRTTLVASTVRANTTIASAASSTASNVTSISHNSTRVASVGTTLSNTSAATSTSLAATSNGVKNISSVLTSSSASSRNVSVPTTRTNTNTTLSAVPTSANTSTLIATDPTTRPTSVSTTRTTSVSNSSSSRDSSLSTSQSSGSSQGASQSSGASTTSDSSSSSTTAALATITSYTPDASTISSIQGVTTNSHVTTGDSNHPSGVYPVLWHCLFCPPGAGLLLWGMGKPGIYPPPTPAPPVPPGAVWPTIAVGDDSNPTPSSEPSKTGSVTSTGTGTSSSSGSSSSSSSTTTSADACETGTTITKRLVYTDTYLVKRAEIVAEYDDPLGRALGWLGRDGLQSATGLISNKLQRGPTQNTKIFGLEGKYTLPKKMKIEGVQMNRGDSIPWKVRWDWDPTDQTKLVHVNGEWGKGGARAKVAYKFPSSTTLQQNQAAMTSAVKEMTQAANVKSATQRTAEENTQGALVFKEGGTVEAAVQAIVDIWTPLVPEQPNC